MEVIGKNIRYLRKLADLTQVGLAKKMGITRGQLGAYEEFRAEPNIEMIVKLASYFRITVDTLVKNDLEKEWKPGDIESMMSKNTNLRL